MVILSHRADLLPSAFASVRAQTYKDVEIVVKFFDGAWWPEKLNEAIRGTCGELFAVLCDDDALAPTWLAECVAALDRDGTDIAYTDNQAFGKLAVRLALPDFTPDTIRLHCVPHFTALTRRALWERVGGYDGAMQHTDWDFWKRCSDAGATASHVRAFLFGYRVSGRNESASIGDAGLAQLRAKHPDLLVEPSARVRVA